MLGFSQTPWKHYLSNFAWWCYSLSFTCLYHFQWPWPYSKVTGVSNSFNWKCDVLMWLSWNFLGLLSMSCRAWICHLFCWVHIFKGDNYIFSFGEKYQCWVFLRHHERTIVQTLHGYSLAWVLFHHFRLMTLTLFQGYRCVRIINSRLCVLASCHLYFNCYMVAIYVHNTLCVTDVY